MGKMPLVIAVTKYPVKTKWIIKVGKELSCLMISGVLIHCIGAYGEAKLSW